MIILSTTVNADMLADSVDTFEDHCSGIENFLCFPKDWSLVPPAEF
jgi:hypothetical protein